MLAGTSGDGPRPPTSLASAALRFSDVNLLVTTDVHSFIASHSHPDHSPQLDADFGALSSFMAHVRAA